MRANASVRRFTLLYIVPCGILIFFLLSTFRHFGSQHSPDSHGAETQHSPVLVKDGIDLSGAQALLNGKAIAPKLENATAKAELGRAAWKVFHTTFARFPDKPTAEESEALRVYVHLFQRLYPW